MIDRIEAQQQDHQQYTERKHYKAIGTVTATPVTNRTYNAWVSLNRSLPVQEPRIASVVPAPVEKCGYHVIHNEGKPTERHEWLLKEHFDSSYQLAEMQGNSDAHQQSNPNTKEGDAGTQELLKAYDCYMKAQSSIPGDTSSPLTFDEFIEIAFIDDWVSGDTQESNHYNRKELDEKFKEKDLRVYKDQRIDYESPEYKEYLLNYLSDPSNPGKPMSPELFNAGKHLMDNATGHQTSEELAEMLKGIDVNATVNVKEILDDTGFINKLSTAVLNTLGLKAKEPKPKTFGEKEREKYEALYQSASLTPMTNKEYGEWCDRVTDSDYCHVNWLSKKYAHIDGMEPIDGYLVLRKARTGSTKALYGWMAKGQSGCDAVTSDLKKDLEAQFDKIKSAANKHDLKQEIDRAEAMVSIATAINLIK